MRPSPSPLRRLSRVVVPVASLAVAVGLLAGPASATGSDRSSSGVRDVPAGAPAAAHREEPVLAAPRGWPFAQRLSRTAGSGRLHGGASYWTDFVLDDHGAAVPSGLSLDNTSTLAPVQGVQTYADQEARGNGADVFVAAVGARRGASFWRVDFATLRDPDVPVAVWALDTDADRSTGTSEWAGSAMVTSPGIDTSLVVSSRGAWLVDGDTGRRTDVERRGGALTVDRDAGSFVVKVPRRLLPFSGRWRIRLATGVADAEGTGMEVPTYAAGVPASTLAPRPYNLAFRRHGQEPSVYEGSQTDSLVAAVARLARTAPPQVRDLGLDGLTRFVTGNFWREDHQAEVLADGDVTVFSRAVRWSQLLKRRSTPEPLVRGDSNRWYVSSLDLGEGVVADSDPSGDGEPNYLGRIQPYAVHVPSDYEPGGRTPLTWVLHSLGVNHNQYLAYNPGAVQDLCGSRGSICATTLGHGPDGWYFNEAEVDYWSVWRSLAKAYDLDTRRTQITGYSMGGWATYHLGLAHPDLYAGAMSLAGPPRCGFSADGATLTQPAFGGLCASDGVSQPLLGNAREVPFRIGQGTLDQLVPFTSVEAQVAGLDALGLRHLFVRYPGEDHLVFATQDRFETVYDGLATPRVTRRPRSIDFTWRPALDDRRLGLGATTAYWTSGLRARDAAPGSLATVRATSRALPQRRVEEVRTGPDPVLEPLPAVVTELAWTRGDPLRRKKVLRLDLTNVRRVTVDVPEARLSCRRDFRLVALSDGPARLRLVTDRGATTVRLEEGTTRLRRPC